MQNPLNPLPGLLANRHSCRAFLADPVPLQDIHRMLVAARSAPSGANLQPGMFHVFTGEPLTALTTRMSQVAETTAPEETQYSYFPQPMPAELLQRQRDAGYALYQALGIGRRDIAGRRAQFAANYRFFDAPVGIIVTIRRDMGTGCYMDLGMALMSFFLAAQDLGYATCGIGALANYGQQIHKIAELPQEELVVCGIALGRADMTAPVNQFRTGRLEPEQFAGFYGFPVQESGQ